jgi:hypothetical protein
MKCTKLPAKRKCGISATAAILLTIAVASLPVSAQSPSPAAGTDEPATGHFACNTAALTSAERSVQQRLTKRLFALRKAAIEYPKGYEFQFSPADISLAELSIWVVNESKCCPFFDFHIDVEERGKLFCLRLTGAEGIKDVIRHEFNIPPPQK